MSSSALYKVVSELMSAKYEIVKPLGNGVFGTVYLVKDTRGNELAMKKIQWHREKASYDSAIRESKAFALTRNHAHIVECIDGYADENYAYIVMEHCDGGNLNRYLLGRRYNYELNLHIMLQLADAVSFLHHNNIWHRDLRPHNIMIKKQPDGQDLVKLSGFAVSVTPDSKLILDGEREAPDEFMKYVTSVENTESFVAPEVYSKIYSEKMDIFSLGVICLAMMERDVNDYSDRHGTILALYDYDQKNYIGKTLAAKTGATRLLDYDVSADDRLRKLINSMLLSDPDERPISDDIYGLLREISDGPQVVVDTGCCHGRKCRRTCKNNCRCCYVLCCAFAGCR